MAHRKFLAHLCGDLETLSDADVDAGWQRSTEAYTDLMVDLKAMEQRADIFPSINLWEYRILLQAEATVLKLYADEARARGLDHHKR